MIPIKADAGAAGQQPDISRDFAAGKVKPEKLGRLGDVIPVGKAAVHEYKLSGSSVRALLSAEGVQRTAAYIRAQVHIQKIPLDLIAGHALVASVLDKIIQVLPRKRRRNGKVHTRREQQAFVGWFHRHHIRESIQKL